MVKAEHGGEMIVRMERNPDFKTPVVEAKTKEQGTLPKSRSWTLIDGSELEGTFKGYSAGRIKLILSDGGSKIIKMSDLSKEDQEYVRDVR